MLYTQIATDKTPVEQLQKYYTYRNWLLKKYDDMQTIREEHNLDQKSNDGRPALSIPHPGNIDWWMRHWQDLTNTDTVDYDLLQKPLQLCKLHDNISIAVDEDNNRYTIKMSVFLGIFLGLIESDDITVDEDPVENPPTLSGDGSESIRLADPREHPYHYIDRGCAYDCLTRDYWKDLFQTDYRMPSDGFSGARQFAPKLPSEYIGRQQYICDVYPRKQIQQEAIAQAMIGVGTAAGVINASNRVYATNNYVLIVNEYWDEYTSEDNLASKSDVDTMLCKGIPRNRDYCFDILRYTNILYQDDGENGYKLNRPVNSDGPTYRDVSAPLFDNNYTYEPLESPPEDFDVDAFAVDQFVHRHTKVGSAEDTNDMWVTVDKFMQAFDEWAHLNAVELDDLNIARADNMRKGEIRAILEANWQIEKASVRDNGKIVRAFRPLELDDAILQLLDAIDDSA